MIPVINTVLTTAFAYIVLIGLKRSSGIWITLYTLPGMGLAFAVLFCAICRTLLDPTRTRAPHLRLGLNELRLLPWGLALAGVQRAIFLTPPPTGISPFNILAVLALLVVATRLSLIPPDLFNSKTLDPRRGWRMASGRFRTLFPIILAAGIGATAVLIATHLIAIPLIRSLDGAVSAWGAYLFQTFVAGTALTLAFVLVAAPTILAYREIIRTAEEPNL